MESFPQPILNIEKEDKEKLPVIGEKMVVVKKVEKNYKDIPGVEAIDQGQEIGWENLAFVRTTKRMPEMTEDGLIVRTPYSGTKSNPIDQVDPRTTTHWTVNHHVRSSSGGWQRADSEQMPVIIISPAKGFVEKNGNPRNFADVDTFWDKDIVLPKDTVIICDPISKDKKFKDIHIISRDNDALAEADVAKILSKIGFTPIKGGQRYSRTEGVSEVFNKFAQKHNLDSGDHYVDETSVFENKYSRLDNPMHVLNAVEFFLQPNHQAVNVQAQELLARKLEDIINIDEVRIQTIAKKFNMPIEKVHDVYLKAKQMIEKVN